MGMRCTSALNRFGGETPQCNSAFEGSCAKVIKSHFIKPVIILLCRLKQRN